MASAAISPLLSACGGGEEVAAPETGQGTTSDSTATAGATQSSAASSPAASSASSSVPERLVFAADSDPETLDATLRAVSNHRRVYGLIYDPLVHRTAEGEIVPWVAESWERTDDTHWRFKLREDVKFHNGDVLDAEAVRFTFSRAADPALSQLSSKLTAISEVNVIEPYVVEFVTKEPTPTLLTANLADLFFIVPPNAYENGDQEQSVNPIGSGPYKFQEWVKGDHITVVANEDYWGGDVPVKEVVIRPIPEIATRVSALLAGEADLAVDVPASQVDRINDSDIARVSVASGPLAIGVRLNLTRDTPLKDQRVRQALNYAVDVEAIIDEILFAQAKPLNGQPLYEGMVGYNPDAQPYAYDPDKAKQLLKEAGYENGFTLRMDVPIGGVPQAVDIAQALLINLEAVGVTLELNQIEWQGFQANLFTPNSERMSDSFLLYINAPSRDGHEILDLEFRCDGAYPNGWNWILYCNERVDELISQESSTFDDAEREAAMQEASAVIGEDAPWIFLHNPNVLWGVKKDLIWEARPDQLLCIWDVYQ